MSPGAHASLKELHDKYNADIVRTGPNELSINNVEAVEISYGGKYPRGYLYEFRAANGELNANTTRRYGKHRSWRGVWKKAFSHNELPDYNIRVEYHVDKFVRLLNKRAQEDIEVVKVVEKLMFDM
ncbi:hypothetical protein BO71DRAFT_428883 [Aspergillus ellipticus CBS 707.79]|uniref:Uncharacterized protein n=1 Tax=Aspergillus ellipticus CBS 707.79 TaxID=1448320 RepID=A0A319DEB4_9EURO|nr:hypothetical protein BO71DRAFT_428883 [Aspergillus ellipticus CBS 707.79]